MSILSLFAEQVQVAEWLRSLLAAFILQTGVVLVLLAVAGALMALWLTVPAARDRMERYTVSSEQQTRDLALNELDHDMARDLRTSVNTRPVAVRVVRKGERYVLADN